MRWCGVLMAGWVAGCSLLVESQFKEPQPCEPVTGACDFGYRCSDAGFCLSSDGGAPVDAGPADAGGCDLREALCGDTRDNDCDNLTDCADPDCGGLACDDRDVCTTGERCSGTTCMRGTPVVCNTPADCQAANGSCEAGTGRCVYPALRDGTLCGAPLAFRCCTGSCINTSINPAHCGGCGLACGTGQTCQSLEACSMTEPANTSGRCTCNAATAPTCPGTDGGASQVCTSGNTCRPANNTQCAPGQTIADGGLACGTYCRYP